VRASEYSSQPAPSIKATTDPDGNYRITGIPVGTYLVSPIGAGIRGERSYVAAGRGKILLLSEGEEVEDVDFTLERGGVIAGKIY